MDSKEKEAGILQALAERMESQRLPRALAMKKRVDDGETLNELDIQFLKEVLDDAQRIMPLVERHPEWQSLAASLINLYQEITRKALENEDHQKGKA
ncbi:hypothetical protein [Photobacterium galatheae]|uniref:Uncharacterized protein n=1 Tax=Photobacterium galatheae TaxID=1654360 RepID=A0A066RQH5_9GAMM|nr:hypothetical protein [Photobacterium galatheae]KDM89633.1 hypothetical protein EA58_21595 [Photobacterium galatheae]MCM0151595.1 hypothetical protein [Photobacterium galatheae]